jgi:hypothetical protein
LIERSVTIGKILKVVFYSSKTARSGSMRSPAPLSQSTRARNAIALHNRQA